MNVDKIIQVRLQRKPVHVASVLREGLRGLQPDLELVGEEGARLGVHSLVLASCSPALATLLATSHSCGQGSVLVPGVGSRELQSTVTLIYHGLVTVAEEDVKLVLETAKLLGIDGIDVAVESQTENIEALNQETLGCKNTDNFTCAQDYKAPSDIEHCSSNIQESVNLGEVDICHDDIKYENEDSAFYQGGDNESGLLEAFIVKEEELKESTSEELKIIRFQKKEMVESTSEHPKKAKNWFRQHPNCRICPECHKVYKDHTNMRYHYNKKHSDAAKRRARISQVCQECGKICKNQEALCRHQLVHRPPQFQCDQCDSTFKSTSNLKTHIKFHHEEYSLFCDQCHFKTATKQLLEQHIKTEHEGFRLQCSECDFQTKTKTQLKSHVNYIHLKLKVTCPICFKEYSGKNTLRNHCAEVHKTEGSIWRKNINNRKKPASKH